MLARSEGPGGIHFDDPFVAQSIGVVALALILFSGGIDTRWSEVKPILPRAVTLSTAGVALTLFVYSFTVLMGGNGFLAVFIAGLVIGSATVVHKESLIRFHEGIA